MTDVLPKTTFLILTLGAVCAPMLVAQQPPVKVNVLNVCTPADEEQKEIASALARVPKQPAFGQDFEVARGRSSLSEAPGFLQAGQSAQISDVPSIAHWVRLRREFPAQSPFSTAQYSFSDDGKSMVETLVLHVRDPKDLVQLSIEDNASSVTTAATMLSAASPASRIKLERFGKSSVVLARCSGAGGGPAPDQSAFEPLFTSASTIMTKYRAALNAPRTVPGELAKVAGEGRPGGQSAPAKSRTVAPKPASQHSEKQ